MNDPAIEVRGLSKYYPLGQTLTGSKTFREAITDTLTAPFRGHRGRGTEPIEQAHLWALKDVSFDLSQGEVLGIIGRNGAGKSTLLKILSRITDPTEGRVVLRGRVGSLLEVGTGFHSELTGRENIYLSGAILGMHRAEINRKLDEIVAFAEVEPFMDTPIKRYSTGMGLRLAFSVAAHLEPEVLLIDEVLAVGDFDFQQKCLGKMRDIGETGRTVVFVSHDMTAMSRLAPTAILLRKGEIAAHGPTGEVMATYLQQACAADDLKDRTDRTGDGVIRLTELRLRNQNSLDVDTLPAGDPLVLSVHYESALDHVIGDAVALDVRFTDALGNPVTTVSTRFVRPEIEDGSSRLQPCGWLSCDLPALAVAEGTYGIDLWLAYRGGLADCVIRAGEVRVIASRFFPGDAPVPRKHGAALLAHHWRWEVDDAVG